MAHTTIEQKKKEKQLKLLLFFFEKQKKILKFFLSLTFFYSNIFCLTFSTHPSYFFGHLLDISTQPFVTDRETDGEMEKQTESSIYIAAMSQLKISKSHVFFFKNFLCLTFILHLWASLQFNFLGHFYPPLCNGETEKQTDRQIHKKQYI